MIMAQSHTNLKNEIEKIIYQKKLTAAISIKNIETQETIAINDQDLMPMMSVFKFHLTLAVLDQVDRGILKLNQKVFIQKEELSENTWSPLREKYPNQDIEITLDELLRYTVSHSDNNTCDILFRLVGGTKNVENYIKKQGINDIVIEKDEAEMNSWDNLYVNVTTSKAATDLLEKFYLGKILSENSIKYLYQLMVETSRGLTWMKAGLPKNTELAHRTGISDVNEENIRAAMNNIGIFKISSGEPIILSIFFKNIQEDRIVTEKLFEEISRATYHYFEKVD